MHWRAARPRARSLRRPKAQEAIGGSGAQCACATALAWSPGGPVGILVGTARAGRHPPLRQAAGVERAATDPSHGEKDLFGIGFFTSSQHTSKSDTRLISFAAKLQV